MKVLPFILFETMARVYLSLGNNLGEKEHNLIWMIQALSLNVGSVIRQSKFYKSDPWGFESENEFLNAVVLLETNLNPFDLLVKTQEIERTLGRTAKSVNGYSDRLIDIDILFYDNLIIDQPALKIPHPLIAERDFVLLPLVEIAPDFVHPVLGRKIIDLIKKIECLVLCFGFH
jgi:2-amino-4-hydroxy-6-hydroxymethyldihydropteridine diphosphokinase